MTGMLNTFEIFIFNQYSEVPCGSTLCGQVVLDCSEDMEVNEISVHFYGRCRVELFDHRVCTISLIDVHGSALASFLVNETFMHEVALCFSPDEPVELSSTTTPPTKILSKGMHVFDFNVNVSHNLPASFDGEFGYTRYFMRAQVQCPRGIEYNTRDFKVIPVVDLNCLSDIECHVEEQTEAEIYTFFKSIGSYRAKMSLYKRGYVPGDVLYVQLEIHNDTIKHITRAVLKLKMVTTYRTKHQFRQTENVLCTSKLSPIDAGYTFHGCDRNLRIPKEAPVSNEYTYRYINVEYFVELFMQPSLLSLDRLKLCAKIEVGTVPINAERLTASLILREPPPKYDDLLPRYEDAINYLLCNSDHSDESQDNSACSSDRNSLQEEDNDNKEFSRNDTILVENEDRAR